MERREERSVAFESVLNRRKYTTGKFRFVERIRSERVVLAPMQGEGGGSSPPGQAPSPEKACSSFLGNVTSVIRVRPHLNGEEKALSLRVTEEGEQVKFIDSKGKERTFRPGHALDSKQNQGDVFNLVGRQVVDCLLNRGGCDGAVLCYGGKGMGKSHTLYETSTSFKASQERTESSSLASTPSPSHRYGTRHPGHEGLLVRVVHDVFRTKTWNKFQNRRNSSFQTPLGNHEKKDDSVSESPGSQESSRNMDTRTLKLQASSFAVTHAGDVLDLLSQEQAESESSEGENADLESLSTPTLKRTKAVAQAKLKQKEMEDLKWAACASTAEFEAKLKPSIDLCRSHEQKQSEVKPASSWRTKKDEIQFVVTQIRLARKEYGPFVSKVAFVLVLPGESLSMEGPILKGTHLSASMLRLRAVLDALTGIGSKNQALLRANASLATMLSAPLGSPRLLFGNTGEGHANESHSSGRPAFVCLIGCISPCRSDLSQVSGFLSFAERAKLATLLHKSKHGTSSAPEEGRFNQLSTASLESTHEKSGASSDSPLAKFLQKKEADKAFTPVNGVGSGGAAKVSNRMDVVPMLTPPSVRAVSKMVWPTASPGTFDAGLSDFAHIREELESIWSGMREAERYHEEALATAEGELHEAEAATRRAGARATEMRKIIASLRAEIENQKASALNYARSKQEGADDGDSQGERESETMRYMEEEIKQLREQVKDEQALRREAEAALAALDDECVRLTEQNGAMSKRLDSLTGGTKSRNVRVQCALANGTAGVGVHPTPADIEVESNGSTKEDSLATNQSEVNRESSEATIGTEIKPYNGDRDDLEDHSTSSVDDAQQDSSISVFPATNQSDPSTPRLVAKKEEPQSSDSEVLSKEEMRMKADMDSQVESNHTLKELPKKENPNEDAHGLQSKKRPPSGDYSPMEKDVMAEPIAENENDNPLVLIIAVNMYKGHTEKIKIHLRDSSEDIAREFVKKHNLPEISIKNLQKLINKNLERNNIVIGQKKKEKEGNGIHTPPIAKEKVADTPSKSLSQTPPSQAKPRFPEIERTPPSSPSGASDSSSVRPLRPVDMYRFIN